MFIFIFIFILFYFWLEEFKLIFEIMGPSHPEPIKKHLSGNLLNIESDEDSDTLVLIIEAFPSSGQASTECSTSSRSKQQIRRVQLSGDWVTFIQEDLQLTWQLHLDLASYSPIWNSRQERWQFDCGLHADLYLGDQTTGWYLKKINIGILPHL